jgi:hypothetical protein
MTKKILVHQQYCTAELENEKKKTKARLLVSSREAEQRRQ